MQHPAPNAPAAIVRLFERPNFVQASTPQQQFLAPSLIPTKARLRTFTTGENACHRTPLPFYWEGFEDEAFGRRPCDYFEPGAPEMDVPLRF
jgi:hypothetical protein